MANRKDEVKKAQKAGEEIVKNPPAKTDKKEKWNKFLEGGRADENDPNLMMSSGSGATVMEGDTRKKTEEPKKEEPAKSLVAEKFADKKDKTWADVKSENGNDPAKIAEYLNNNPDYKAGDLTKKGMAEMGYKQGEDGKWTIDQVLDELDNISAEVPEVGKQIEEITNPETGEVDEDKARKAVSDYEAQLVNLGAGTFDENGNFVLKPTNKSKGWETWATMISVGLSVIGIAMGIPIYPINFRAITGKDSRDAQIQALQQQYMNIKADSAGTIDKMNADVGAGQIAQNNADALAAQEKHAQATAATKDVIGAQTGAEKELIETRTDAEIRKDEAQFKRDMARLQSDQNFQLKLAALQQQYSKEMAELQSALTTGSAIDVMKYQNSGFLKDLKDMGMSFSDIASYTAAKNGISPSDKNWNRVNMAVGMVTDVATAASNFVPGNKAGK